MASNEYTGYSSTNIEGNSWFDLTKSDYAKVIFSDLYHNPVNVGCRFQITDNVHEDPCDYVGLFKVGYENLSQCLISKLLSETECEEDGKLLRCTFKSSELPELDHGFYQFLYVTRDNEVCGASMPFEIKPIPKKFSLDDDIVADKTEDDFLVVRSNLAEHTRNLQALLDKMSCNNLDQEKEYAVFIEKLSGEKTQLEKELKTVSEERDKLTAECKKITDEKDVISKEKQEAVKNLEKQIENLASRVDEAYDKFRMLSTEKNLLEEEKNKLSQEKADLKASSEKLMSSLIEKLAAMDRCQKELILNHQEELKKARAFEDTSSLASQLDDAKLMIAALEESKLLVMNEVTQLTESNNQFKDKFKVLKCENIALSLKLRDAETFYDKLTKKYQNNKKEIAALKFHFRETGNLQASVGVHKAVTEKTKLAVEEVQFAACSAPEEQKVINVSQPNEENLEKVQCDLLTAGLKEKELIILKLKEECLKKDAIIEYLSKEKDNVQKTSIALEDAFNDSILRLKEAADIYRKQFLEIEKLKKKLDKTKSKSKDAHCSESSSTKDEMFSSVDIGAYALEASSTRDELQSLQSSALDVGAHASEESSSTRDEELSSSVELIDDVQRNEEFAEDAQPPEKAQNGISDSDTGEHVLGNSTEVKKKISPRLQALLDSPEKKRIDKSHPHLSEKFNDLFGQSLDISYLAVASASDEPSATCRESPELQTMIDQNIAKLGLSKSKETEDLYCIPCPICELPIGVPGYSTEEMIKHLEMQHSQQICPICGKLFDMTLPNKYFEFHVEDHFMKKK